jgi:cytochrome c peroxidase
MISRGLIAGALIAFVGSMTVIAFFVVRPSFAQEPRPYAASGYGLLTLPPAPAQTRNVVPLSAAEQLGKDIFFDKTLSNPIGLSCATCHVPSAGFTGESSNINRAAGPMPGVVPGRFGRRKPQAVPYAAFSPPGPYYDSDLDVFLGGNFWDGRAPDTAAQARMPFLDADEMANTPVGPYPPHSGGYSPLVAEKLRRRPYARLFAEVFGADVWDSSDAAVYSMATTAIAAYEASAEVDQFSSKFDASNNGTPPMSRYHYTRSEANGLALFFGKAQCSQCHSSATLQAVTNFTNGKDTFTMYCYANIGVPRNPSNPFYRETDARSNPNGYNAQGASFVDYGLGGNPNPSPSGVRFMNAEPGDIAQFRGLFKAPSVRNVDKRPGPGFVKAFMHNAVFKSLEEVVHFYNKRNIAVNRLGQEVAFDLRVGPPPGYTRLFAPPEVLDNVQNVAGVTPDDATDDVASNGQVGNLRLTPSEEAALVDFLRTLTDGFTRPNPVEQE